MDRPAYPAFCQGVRSEKALPNVPLLLKTIVVMSLGVRKISATSTRCFGTDSQISRLSQQGPGLSV
jgi:hypothetical protein